MAKKKSPGKTRKKTSAGGPEGEHPSHATPEKGLPENEKKVRNRSSSSTKEEAGQGAASEGTVQPHPTGFPVVGIGASAGGLEALTAFFGNMPNDTGMAFVVVTHQHPSHTSLLPELLGRETQMPVVQATDGVRLEPNHVYVGPPGEHVSIDGGLLHLIAGTSEGSPRMPVDHFFRSLAMDQRERAICIILSGTGTDGSVGLKTIKAESGMAMVQQPQSARFAGMPASAIATGLADYVLSPEAMPDQLLAYARGPYLRGASMASEGMVIPAEPMKRILLLLRNRTSHDFSGYKTSTIRRRIQRRMNVHQIDNPLQYVRYLQENPHEIDVLFKELLISVTRFFRDEAAWKSLAKGPLQDLMKSRPRNDTLRAWVPGCATGEEVYSLAILLRECAKELSRSFHIQIFGTDLDSGAINTARMARYPDGIVVDVPPEYLERYLVREDGSYRVQQEIREMVIFAPQNLIKDSPFTKLDILCCRNLLIYLNSELQKRLLPVFHYALKPGGLLFLGPSETIGGYSDLFETLDHKWKIFRRKETATARLVTIPVSLSYGDVDLDAELGHPEEEQHDESHPEQEPKVQSIERLIERLLLARFCPAALVINDQGDIIHIHGRTGAYLEPSEGRPRMNALEMARDGLQLELSAAVRLASVEENEVVRKDIRIKANGHMEHVDLTVVRLSHPEPIRGLFLVTFRPATTSVSPPEVEPKRHLGKQTQTSQDHQALLEHTLQLEREIDYLKVTQQTTREELETSNEELKSTNEELQSTNEELQSSNEELETSKEELQSLNEELTTVNSELQSKVEDLSHANDDMQNLLNSIEVATVFLDSNLNIRRYTETTRDLISLRPSDVGRPISDLAMNLRCGDLVNQCKLVLKTLLPIQREITSNAHAWYMMRIMPYRTTRNAIDGVVVTFVNIDELRRARDAAGLRTYFENLFDAVHHPLIVLDESLHVVSANSRFRHIFALRNADISGKPIYEIGEQEWDIPELRVLLDDILSHRKLLENYEVCHHFRSIGQKRFLLNARRVEQEAGLPELILLGIEDITDQDKI